MNAVIRIADADDAEQILAIYSPFIERTAVSFEIEPPSAAAMRERMGKILECYPWLVLEMDGAVAGYAYASRHRERPAYQWSAETAVYVAEGSRRCGVGSRLYAALLPLLGLQGLRNAYAGITLPNPASVALHEAIGFRLIGIYEKIGFKLGAWHDVGWWRLALREHDAEPGPPVAFPRIRSCAETGRILARAAAGAP